MIVLLTRSRKNCPKPAFASESPRILEGEPVVLALAQATGDSKSSLSYLFGSSALSTKHSWIASSGAFGQRVFIISSSDNTCSLNSISPSA